MNVEEPKSDLEEMEGAMNRLRNKLGDEKGIALPFVAVTLGAVMLFTAFGIETGRLGTVANEVQAAADIAATAAAGQMIKPQGLDTPTQSALTVLAENRIDGTTVTSSNLKALEFGLYNDEIGFIAGLAPFNAARAEVEYTVQNIMLKGWGHPTMTITREAVAAFQGASSGVPLMPIAIGECLLNPGCAEEGCQPFLRQVPNIDDNSAWTTFFDKSGVDNVRTFFPELCGGTKTSPELHIGDYIELTNGSGSNLFDAAECMFNNAMREVLVPVVNCDVQYNHSRVVLGFARFEIVTIDRTGGMKGLDIRGLLSANDAPTGGGQYGTGSISLVK